MQGQLLQINELAYSRLIKIARDVLAVDTLNLQGLSLHSLALLSHCAFL